MLKKTAICIIVCLLTLGSIPSVAKAQIAAARALGGLISGSRAAGGLVSLAYETRMVGSLSSLASGSRAAERLAGLAYETHMAGSLSGLAYETHNVRAALLSAELYEVSGLRRYAADDRLAQELKMSIHSPREFLIAYTPLYKKYSRQGYSHEQIVHAMMRIAEEVSTMPTSAALSARGGEEGPVITLIKSAVGSGNAVDYLTAIEDTTATSKNVRSIETQAIVKAFASVAQARSYRY